MHQAFTRIESGDQNYYLLTNLFDGGNNGFDLTVCNGEQVWRETGKVIVEIYEQCQRCQQHSFRLAAA